MARSTKPQSSDEPNTEDSNSIGDVPIEDEEELRAVERTAESEEEEDAKGDDAAVQEDDDDEGDNTNEISRREKARLKQMEAMKRKKIQEIRGNQNASIDADMNNKGKGRLKYLLQQTEIFAHFAKSGQSAPQKKAKGRYSS